MPKLNQIVFFVFLILTSTCAFAKTDIEYILDVSGSMRQITDGKPQIDSAKQALLDSLLTITGDTQVAVRVYAHRIDQANKTESCRDTELLESFAPLNIESIKPKILALTPKGYTPIAYALEQSRNDFNLAREAEKVIILLSDGEETCGGNPVDVVKKMIADGFKVVINVIGFNVDETTRKQLQDIAATGGGQYFDANSAQGLSDSLKKATEASLVIQKTSAVYGSDIRGGDAYETAVMLNTQKEYKLDHHQKQNQFDYFYVDLKAGQELSATVATLQKGVNINAQNMATENTNPYAGIQIHGPNRNRLAEKQIIGEPNKSLTIKAIAADAGRYYILLGSTYNNMNKDHVTFQITTTSRGDLGTEIDAGDSIQNALAISFQKYPVNYLSPVDKIDVYKFEGQKGDTLSVGFIPNNDNSPMLDILVHDAYKQTIMQTGIPGGQGKKTDAFALPDSGTYYLVIKSDYTVESLHSYMFEVIKTTP